MEDINKRLQIIEKRLERIEAQMQRSDSIIPVQQSEVSQEGLDNPDIKLIKNNTNLESDIGRYGLAWMGSVVLLLGIIFLTQWIQSLGNPLMASLIGYASAAGLLIIQHYIRQSNNFLGLMFRLSGLFLLFYFTLRLHYFSPVPIIESDIIGLVLLISVVIIQLYSGIRSGKEFFTVYALFIGYFTGLVSGKPVVMLAMNFIFALTSLYLLYRYSWKRTFIISLITCYLVFLLWILNNPLMGNPVEVISQHGNGHIFLFACAIVYAMVPYIGRKTDVEHGFMASTLWLNSSGFSLVFLFITLQFFGENFAVLFSIIAIFCLGYAFLLRIYIDWKFGSAFYALYGFLALSISLHGLFGFPTVHLFLALESLLVVSMALWFRNKLIVIMNGVLFTMLLVAYFASPKHLDSVNVAYALVPLITARVLNWKKQRLEIKTDMLRNLYLVTGFTAVLYALYHLVPHKFISLSWTIVAVLYFMLSFLLRNVKYRYMAIGTVISAAFYLFLIDLARIDLAYRVLAFLFLAIISIGVSIYYSRRITKQE